MICNNCGTNVSDDSKHCPICGRPLSNNTVNLNKDPNTYNQNGFNNMNNQIPPNGNPYPFNSGSNQYGQNPNPNQFNNFNPNPMFNQSPMYQQQPGNGTAVASMVLGICSLVFFCLPLISIFPAVIGLILGIIAIKKNIGKGMSIAGIVTSSIGLLWAVLIIVLALMGYGSDKEISRSYEDFLDDYYDASYSVSTFDK